MKKIICLLLACSVLLVSRNISVNINAKEVSAEPEQLYARSAVLMDADSGRVLFGKEENTVRAMASTTKIMTCILALEHMEKDQIATISANAAKQPKVKLGVAEKEQYRLLDLLYSLMLESHNDSAVVIAETIAGTVEKFAEMMNAKAKEIGCTSTYFITPNGLDAKDDKGVHSTTAKDLALIMRYCISQSPKQEEFLQITQTKEYRFTNVSGREFFCNNHNAFLTMMEGALSGKTGFTGDAGYCYVGALKRGKKTFIVALLACGWPNNKTYKWADTKKLMTYGLENYEYRSIWKEMEFPALPVKNGRDEENAFERKTMVPLLIKGPQEKWEMLLRNEETVDVTWRIEKSLKAPVKKGEKVGELTYMLGNAPIAQFEIVTGKAMGSRSFGWCLTLVMNHLLL